MTKNLDTILRAEHALYVHFGATGETKNATMLRLDRGITIEHSGTDLIARYTDGQQVVIDKFPILHQGYDAERRLKDAVRNYIRIRKAAHIWKSLVKWVILPLVAFIFVLALNTTVVGITDQQQRIALQQPYPAPVAAAPQQQAQQPQRPAVAMPTAADMARIMSEGVKSGKYSVQLSSGDKGTLYVFSDPACRHCQRLEEELDKLAKDYTIHLFPVSVIGGEKTAKNVSKLLCAKPEKRRELWKQVVKGKDVPGEDCDAGNAAASRNDKIFIALRFEGTPTIINSNGEQTPDHVANRADEITAWLEENK